MCCPRPCQVALRQGCQAMAPSISAADDVGYEQDGVGSCSGRVAAGAGKPSWREVEPRRGMDRRSMRREPGRWPGLLLEIEQ